MHDFTFHMVIGKRVTIHARHVSGQNGQLVNFDSDELPRSLSGDTHSFSIKEFVAEHVVPRIADLACLNDSLHVRRAGLHLRMNNHLAEYGCNEVFMHLTDFAIAIQEER